jgi:phage terminase large subunit-like protein
MRQRGRFLQVDAHVPEKRKKSYRIIDSIGAAVASSQLYVSPTHLEFIEQYASYPNVVHDDLIEAVAVGVKEAMEHAGGGDFRRVLEIENIEYDDIPTLGACP